MTTRDDHVALIEKFWTTLYVDRDLDAVGAMFSDDGFYEDFPSTTGAPPGPARSPPGCGSASRR